MTPLAPTPGSGSGGSVGGGGSVGAGVGGWVGGGGSGVLVAVGSGGSVLVGGGGVGGMGVGEGMGVLVGVGKIEICCWTCTVGVKVGKGVRVGGSAASSSPGSGSRDSNEQPKLSKIKTAPTMLQARVFSFGVKTNHLSKLRIANITVYHKAGLGPN